MDGGGGGGGSGSALDGGGGGADARAAGLASLKGEAERLRRKHARKGVEYRVRQLPLALAPLGGFFGYQVVYMAASGILGGSVISLQAPLTVDMVGIASLPLAQGLFHVAQAGPVLAAPPIAGAVRTAAGDFSAVWLAPGALILASAAIVGGARTDGWAGARADLAAARTWCCGGGLRRWARL